MEIVSCAHIETMEDASILDMQIGTCKVCGQVRQFTGKDETIVKLGRVGDKIVMPPVGHRLALTPEESRWVSEGWEILNPHRESKGRWGSSNSGDRQTPKLEEAVIEEKPTSEEMEMEEKKQLLPPRLRQKEIEAQKEQILADLPVLGVGKTRAKYGISSNGWCKIMERWGVPNRPRRQKQEISEPPDKSSALPIDWKLKYESYRQAVLDIFGNKGEN